tara:strand:- start:526 stop:930 length:405 start_codon:yes stop_codon:yes gene_type:complete
MLNFITISISLSLILLTGWTFITYFLKKDSQQFIKEELSNLFDICKKFFLSLKNLIEVLTSASISYEEKEATTLEKTILRNDKQSFNLVQPLKEIQSQSVEVSSYDADDDYDDALSSFSPEVIEVIDAEEEKVA